MLSLENYVMKEVSEDETQDPGHLSNHIYSVYKLGMEIGRAEGANMRVLEAGLWLHDIERPNDPKKEKIHAQLSAKHASEILPRFGYLEDEIPEILHAIRAHSRSDLSESPCTLEAKIVYDADKIDGLGDSGISRAKKLCMVRGYKEKETARWYLGRIIDVLKQKPPLYTKKAETMARPKLRVSLNFCEAKLGDECKETLKDELSVSEFEYLQRILRGY